MSKKILIILVGKRSNSAVNVQKILTAWGCWIKTRLGIHDGVLNNCSDEGLIICEVVGDIEKLKELERKLDILPDVKAQLVEISL